MGTPGSFKYASSSPITFIGPTDSGLGVSISVDYKDWLALLFLLITGLLARSFVTTPASSTKGIVCTELCTAWSAIGSPVN